jgi:putative membrane protein
VTHVRISFISVTALVAAIGIGCSSNKGSSTDSAAGTAAVPGTTPAAAPASPSAAAPADSSKSGQLTDANILAKADAGDSTETAVGKYMAANTSNAAVKSYAQLLERDHAKGISEVEAVAKKASIQMQMPSGDTTVQAAQHALDHLKSLSGKDRDTAFVNHEIEDHQHDIDDTKQMESSAKSPEVKSLLEKELPVLRKHLDRAQALQKQLGGGKS